MSVTRTILVGTGPSLTPEAIRTINAHIDENLVYAMNNAFLIEELHIDTFFACNPAWWRHYGGHPLMKRRRERGMQCWTWDRKTAGALGINWIEGRWSGGKRNVTSLSRDPGFIHYGHGSGYETLGLAYAHGLRDFVLIGYDLRYPPGSARHFFGEYPAPLQHWPKTGPAGEMTGLLDCYDTIDPASLGIKIINCSPGSALTRFGLADLHEELSRCE
jgi:hypothetical protein